MKKLKPIFHKVLEKSLRYILIATIIGESVLLIAVCTGILEVRNF